MALCHDERDHAMGWGPDPHSPRLPTSSERKRVEKRKNYLDALTPEQRQAYERVELCLAAVGWYLWSKGEPTNLTVEELHQLFPAFASAVGYTGSLYQFEDGKCPAVSLSYPESKDGFWFLLPFLEYRKADEEKRVTLQTEKVRLAALAFCKTWLPDWGWDSVTLRD